MQGKQDPVRRISAPTPTRWRSDRNGNPIQYIIWFVGLLALALGIGPGATFAGEIRCASAESMEGLMQAWTKNFNVTHPDSPARVTRRTKFSAEFVEPLASGELSVATFARELFPSERAKFREITGREPRFFPIATGSRATKGGTHAIVIFVHETNPLTHLSVAQLQEIFSQDGTITTWGQLGLTGAWAEHEIDLQGMRVRRRTGNPPGIVNFLESRLLGVRPWRDNVHQYSDTADGTQSLEHIVRAVAADEFALGYSGFAYAVSGVKALSLGETEAGPFFSGTDAEVARSDYPLARKIYLATGPEPDSTTREFLRYVLSPEGQALVAADPHGFSPLTEQARVDARGMIQTVDVTLTAYRPHKVEFPDGAGYLTREGAIAVVGYNDMREMLMALGRRFTELQPGFRFAWDLPGTKAAPGALAEGRSAFAPMGAVMTPPQLAAYEQITNETPILFRIAHGSINARALGGPLAIFVHKDNPLDSLTLPEVAAIFDGTDRSRGLIPVGLFPEAALGLFMRERVLQGNAFGPEFMGLPQSREVVARVGEDPRAIGFASACRAAPAVKMLALAEEAGGPAIAVTEENVQAGRYPLDRHLLIYVRSPIEPWVREFLRFVLSPDGQACIAAGTLGYLPLNPAEVAMELDKLKP